MRKISLLVSLFSFSSVLVADISGIPYAIKCTGKKAATSISLSSAQFEGNPAILRGLSHPNARFAPVATLLKCPV